MHYTLYLHCFHIFIFWYFDRMQTTIYRIVLRQFPLAFVFSLVWSVAALSFVCLFIQIPLDLLDERKQRKHSKWRQQAAYLSLPSSSSCSMLLLLWIGGVFFSSKYTIRWPFVLPHNQYVLCYLLWCRGNVVAVVASCSRNSLPFLRRFVKMTLLFQFYRCLCRECNVTKKEETSEWMKLCYFSVLSSSCSICFPTVALPLSWSLSFAESNYMHVKAK